MNVDKFIADNLWEELDIKINRKTTTFVVFDWNDIRTREEDGKTNIYEYFIGWDTQAYRKVMSNEWLPFGAGEMFAGALKYDGGFEELNNGGMLFADVTATHEDPPILFVGDNGKGQTLILANHLSELQLVDLLDDD